VISPRFQKSPLCTPLWAIATRFEGGNGGESRAESTKAMFSDLLHTLTVDAEDGDIGDRYSPENPRFYGPFVVAVDTGEARA